MKSHNQKRETATSKLQSAKMKKVPFDRWETFTVQTMHFNTGCCEICVLKRIFSHFPSDCVVNVTVFHKTITKERKRLDISIKPFAEGKGVFEGKTHWKNSSIFDIWYCLVGVLTSTSSGFQKCGDGISHAKDGLVICSALMTLPLNAKEPKSSPMANTLIALALPAHAPASDITRAMYLSFHA